MVRFENEGLSTNKTIIAQRFLTGHVLIGKTITRFDANLRKAGSPTGDLTARIINSSNVQQLNMGTLDVDEDLTTEFVTKTFENTDGYVLADGDRLALYYASGDGSNYPDWQMNTTIEAYTNGSYYLNGSWTERESPPSGREFTMAVYGY